MQGNKQEASEVVSLCKMAEKHGVPIYLKSDLIFLKTKKGKQNICLQNFKKKKKKRKKRKELAKAMSRGQTV